MVFGGLEEDRLGEVTGVESRTKVLVVGFDCIDFDCVDFDCVDFASVDFGCADFDCVDFDFSRTIGVVSWTMGKGLGFDFEETTGVAACDAGVVVAVDFRIFGDVF